MDDRCFKDCSRVAYGYGIGQPLYEHSGGSLCHVDSFSYRIGRLQLYLEQQCHGEPHDGHAYGYDQLHGHGDGSVHVFGNVYGGDGNGRSFGGRSDCHDGCHDLFRFCAYGINQYVGSERRYGL
jgi:hypothetical protein